MTEPRLLDGKPSHLGAEGYREHVARLGHMTQHGRALLESVERSGLTGRGGAGFLVGRKWRAASKRPGGVVTVVANGAEGEPRSQKDSLLMATRPHLVLDGAVATADALRAREVVLYIGEKHLAARQAMGRALAERAEQKRLAMRVVLAPDRYVAGESGAALHSVADGVALPTSAPALPALVHNVETLAQVAMVGRRGRHTGTVLVTVAGAVRRPGVLELDASATVQDAIAGAGGAAVEPRAVLLGGYFGTWLDCHRAFGLHLDPAALKEAGLSLGCGVIGLLACSRCAVCETAGIMRYLSAESAAQCGPCFFGLRALADACTRVATTGSNVADLTRLQRWATEVRGRGGCKHPDGVVLFLLSALTTFSTEFANHPAHGERQSA